MGAHDSAALLIKVIPKSRANTIAWEKGILKIRIQAVAEKGEANRELIRFLSKIVKIPQQNIILVRGETSRLKHITFEGISQEELTERLQSAAS